MDTMSLHCAVGGISSQQRPAWLKYNKGKGSSEPKIVGKWVDAASMNSLYHVARLYLKKTMDKSARNIFKDATMKEISNPEMFQQLMDYCATDVETTHAVYKKLLPKFREKCAHPISFAGLLHMAYFI
jgi:DNA polymerase gamma 1